MSQTRLPADQALDEWFHTPLGRSLQAMEVNCLRGILRSEEHTSELQSH